jgi:MYXO-CTERM domain-containing protein
MTATVAAAPRTIAPAYRLSGALAAVTAVATALTCFVPGLLRGPAVMNGSARGTALVILVLTVPVLIGSMVRAAQGSVPAHLVWLGAVAHLLYNGVMFLFATPANPLFLLYVAMLGLALWSALVVVRRIDVDALPARFAPATPVRFIAGYLGTIAVLNTALWLSRVVPPIVHSGQPGYLDGTGLPTNPVFVQDLAWWLPLALVAAGWLWRRRPWGYLAGGAILVMWTIESPTVAVDQWWGHVSDPASPVASAAAVPLFVVLTLIGLVPLYLYFRSLSRHAA